MLPMASLSAGLTELAYMLATALFVVGIKQLSKVKTASRGNRIAAAAMGLAVVATVLLLFAEGNWDAASLLWALPPLAVGSGLGWWLAVRVPMTAMPEFVAIFNGLGGAASMLVALAEVPRVAARGEGLLALEETLADSGGADFAVAVALSVAIGAVTLSGSLIAYAKLAGKLAKSRVGLLGETWVNSGLALACVLLAVWGGFLAESSGALHASSVLLALAALTLGVGLTLPIGGADMPVAIALLNSYSGIAGMTTGFVLGNNLLIVAGSLVGASGIILTQIMCKAMNRSLSAVLLGTIAESAGGAKDEGYTKVKSVSAEDVAPVLEAARSLIVVPGYGLAVAQAQHKVRELCALLQSKGCDVKYAIHPVAGRMPGHMNILLAEADVPYEQLFELERINSDFRNTDVVLVLGANDVCNPAAEVQGSAIYGMPVLSVWEARTVIVVKRSLGSGYAGIRNELFQKDNSLMLLADAKKALEDLIRELKAG